MRGVAAAAPGQARPRLVIQLRLLLKERPILHQPERARGVGRPWGAAPLRAHAPVGRPHQAEPPPILADAARGLEAPALSAARGAGRDAHVRGGAEAVLPRQALRVLVPVVGRARVCLL